MLQYCIGCDLWIIHQPTCFYKIILDLGSPLILARGEGGVGQNEFTVKIYVWYNDCIFKQQFILRLMMAKNIPVHSS